MSLTKSRSVPGWFFKTPNTGTPVRKYRRCSAVTGRIGSNHTIRVAVFEIVGKDHRSLHRRRHAYRKQDHLLIPGHYCAVGHRVPYEPSHDGLAA
ncbi:MAG: hypothetical protein ACUVXJ_19590, partial [Phycisphaerae bacterium]